MMVRCIRAVVAVALLAGLSGAVMPAAAQPPVEVSFYYPVAVGGAVTKIIDSLAADFQKENPGIKVKPIYAGTYQETIVKALTALKSGEPPQMSVLSPPTCSPSSTRTPSFPSMTWPPPAEDKAWLKSFFPAFMLNSQTGGKTWGIPFQRSTIVLYWNKESFRDAGLDPNRPPTTWAEQIEYAKKLTKHDASGKVTHWGLKVPSSGFPYWLFQGFTTQNDVLLMNQAGTETYFDKPAVIEALQYWVDLSQKHKVMPPGIIEWGTTPKDFFERQTAMMWTTTGNLTNVKNNTSFEFGVAMLPAGKRRGSPTGGGNFHIFKKSTPAQQAASLKFIKWITSPERAACVGHRHGVRGRASRRVGDGADEALRGGIPAGRGGARPAAVRGGRALHPRQPARDQGAQRRPAGRAHRREDAGAGHEGLAARG
jgi:ABC-type sugar transport system, periplasmic component